ncbi:hypothetical protein ACFQJ5_16660 [Halomicroarcula sp. GCM10025324]|uniref:hypothetical protein n=1 Tax=Haloarcula TaxID=2237 RepID=UPI0023E8746E|nr:hypothetical protein [Halomicroarcula sp. ZS-22-S1]
MAEGDWTGRLQSIANVSNGDWTNILPKTLLLPVIAFFASLADAIGAFFDIPINTGLALGEGIGDLIDAFLGGGANIIQSGATESSTSLASGIWAQFGPFSFAVAIGSVVIGALIISRARQEESTSNIFPGAGGIDAPEWLPFVGEEEGDG